MRIAAFLAVNAGLLRTVGWSLLHFLWQGSILALALSAVLRIARNLSPQVRYLAACGVFVLMLLCPVGTFLYLAAATSASSTSAVPLRTQVGLFSLQSEWDHASSSLFESFAVIANREMPWILAAWCVGVLIFLTHLLIGSIAVERLKIASLAPVPDALQSIASRLARQLKVSRSYRLRASPAIAGPIVIGWLRPVILVPLASLASLSVEQIEALLAHELAHIIRHDYLVNTVQAVTESLLFYHPAVWWVSKQIRQEREHCCDDIAVRVSGSPLHFAKALSLLEQQRASASPQLILGANGGNTAMRIKRLLRQKEPAITLRGTAIWLISTGIITIVSVFSLCNLAAAGAGAQSVVPPSQDKAAVLVSAKDHTRPDIRPDMACTYYDIQTQAHPGTCGIYTADEGHYYCTSNEDKKQSQLQIGCKWKVQLFQQWKSSQHRTQ